MLVWAGQRQAELKSGRMTRSSATIVNILVAEYFRHDSTLLYKYACIAFKNEIQ